MTDYYAFIRWLWRCDPRFAVRAQEYFDHWHQIIGQCEHVNRPLAANECLVDGRYRIVRGDVGLALYSLGDNEEDLLAYYQTPGALFADLITHSIYRSGDLSAEAFAAEATRLVQVCRQAYARIDEAQP